MLKVTPFVRVLPDQVVIGLVGMSSETFHELRPDIDLLPVDAVEIKGHELIGRLYVPGRRHCLLYESNEQIAERGWPWLTPDVWPLGDELIADADTLALEVLEKRQVLVAGTPEGDQVPARYVLMDMVTGQPIDSV